MKPKLQPTAIAPTVAKPPCPPCDEMLRVWGNGVHKTKDSSTFNFWKCGTCGGGWSTLIA
ncbi:hypothetical protein NDI44_27140 [Trichocoleus sp. DQ-A3]|uniref:hypothetical protein n=1 Tax=Cyanophyceae TaxID=3028117 RepID=UPI001689C5E7|nr:hypothetical protein [Coleofasciculus sp. FACHB-125]MBD1903863.1 hypothetical protein [Coleofasciculus sp. FACHB-125]